MIESLPLEPGSLLKRREDGSFAEFACRAAVLESGALGTSTAGWSPAAALPWRNVDDALSLPS